MHLVSLVDHRGELFAAWSDGTLMVCGNAGAPGGDELWEERTKVPKPGQAKAPARV